MSNNVGIIGYGTYIPRYRIKKEEYIKTWGHFSGKIEEKSVIGYDEDVITMAVEAGYNAIHNSRINKNDLKLIAIGSVSSPYNVKSMASEVAMALGLPMDILLLDFTESEKAGTTALSTGIDIIENKDGYGLIIGSDAPLATPGDSLEHVQAAAAAAIVIGNNNKSIAEIVGKKTANIEYISDRFKRNGTKMMKDLEIAPYSNYAYNNTIKKTVNDLTDELKIKLDEFDHVYIQGHDSRQPTRIFKQLNKNKIYLDTLRIIGDTGAASALLGLNAILYYKAKENDRILIVSYGSGAGSDAIGIKVNRKQDKINEIPTIDQYINRKEYINYEKYLKFKELIDLD
ncbi:MAG: hydroxymethylglutaryl-CoA synthase [Candidatus Helarchaeota archaeon]